MDSYREHPSDFDLPSATEAPAADEIAAEIGSDERRMHVRAYNYWASLLNGRDFPSIEDLEPADVQDFADHSVLLDFTCGGDNPAVPYIGADIRDECGLHDDTRTIADVPSRSLLSRLTDHYMQIIANRAPVGFEAEFDNQRSETICYRGILMPFSSDGETIDFIYGVINWKTAGADAEAPAAHAPMIAAIAEVSEESPEEPLELTELVEEDTAPTVAFDPPEPEGDVLAPVHFSWEDGPLAEDAEGEEPVPEIALDERAGLADRLWAARETAEAAKAGEGRTRAALYKALSLAYDFALASNQSPADYAELLEESGVTAQDRAPMTPIVKLVFGVDYDKARLTEFAAALSYAQRQQVATGGFLTLIETQAGGLKALVAAERKARRPDARPDTATGAACAKLRTATPFGLTDLPADEEFVLVVTRRGADGQHQPVAIVSDQGLLERALRRAVA
jgi:hypothetical protein